MSATAASTTIFRHARANKVIVVCALILIAIAALSVLGPLVLDNDYRQTAFDNRLLPPTTAGQHLFGTDDLGRDLLSRTLLGVRITMSIAVVASIVSLFLGVLYGAIAGYVGGKVDALMMRFVDALYALPFVFFVILLMVFFERSILLIFIAIGAINWLDMARIVRGQTISLKQRAFVDAARVMGVSAGGIVWRHIAPNLLGIVVVYVTLAIPQAILVESFLSFLGLGVQEPQTSLGALVHAGLEHMEQVPTLLIIPALTLAVILMCFNFLGDGLRDLTDPKRRT